MALAALIVRIGADLTGLNKGLSQMDRDVAKAGRQLSKVGGTLSQNLTAPILAAGAALAAASISVGNFADELLDLVDQTGLTTDTLQEFRHVALAAGVGSDTLAQAAIKLTTKLTGGAEQSKALTDAVGKLGLSVTDANGRLVPMDSLLPSIIGRLQGMSDVTTRNTLAADIFGKSWAELAPVLGMGAGAMEKARAEAQRLGLVMSAEALEAADKFRQKLDTLKASAGAVTREIGIAVLPIMEKLADFLQKDVVPAVRSIVKWFNDLSPATKTTIGVVAGLVAAVGPLLVVLGGIMAFLPLIAAGFAAVTGPIGAMIIGIGGLIAAGVMLVKNWDSVKLQFLLAWTQMKDAVFTGTSWILQALSVLFAKVPSLSMEFLSLAATVDALAKDSLLGAMPKIDALTDKILKSSDATGTFTKKVTQLGNALASLPKNISLGSIPGFGVTKTGVGGNAGGPDPKGPFVFTDEMKEGLWKNIPKPDTPGTPAPGRGSMLGQYAASGVGGQAGQIMQGLAAGLGPFAALMPVINGALESLQPVLDALIEPLVDLGRIIGEAVAPVLEMLAPILTLVVEQIGRGLMPVIKVLTFAFSFLMEGLGWLVYGIGKLIDSLPFVSAGKIMDAGQAMIEAARAARAGTKATDDATKATEKFASALSNIPRVLNVNALRHNVTGGGIGGGSSSTSYGNIYITIPGSASPEATAQAVGRAIERKQVRGGTTRLVLAT